MSMQSSGYLTDLYDNHFSLTVKSVTKLPAPWLTEDIWQSTKSRDAAFRKAKRTKSHVEQTTYKRLKYD